MKISRTTVRKSLPMSERDLVDLAALRTSPDRRAALSAASGVDLAADASDAAILHAVWEAGLAAVRARVEEDGYAEMAVQQDVSSRRAAARRRRQSWADES
ncbi:hypothetical protein [Brevibacterium litoralis]|uniref:hypothetical protein n=1 Tax=Brevibacterium litoralis TaxID=3138935 RepID=UPI0032ECCAB5